MSKRADRLATMLVGYLIASVASSAAMATLSAFAGLLTRPIAADPSDASAVQISIYLGAFLGSIWIMTIFFSFFVALFAFVQSALLIGLAELLGVRAAIYYAMAGMIATFTAPSSPLYFPRYGVAGHGPDMNLWSLLLFGISGCAGGLAYWWFAGRDAEGAGIAWQDCKSKICSLLLR